MRDAKCRFVVTGDLVSVCDEAGKVIQPFLGKGVFSKPQELCEALNQAYRMGDYNRLHAIRAALNLPEITEW